MKMTFRAMLVLMCSLPSLVQAAGQAPLIQGRELAPGAAAYNLGFDPLLTIGTPQSSYVPATGLGSAANYAYGTLPYLPSGTGGVQETISKALSRIVWVDQYGADPTGVADSTNAINSLINSGLDLHFTCGGTYVISSVLTLSARGVKLNGCSSGTTAIKQTSTTADILDVSGSNNTVDGLYFIYNSTPSAGNGIKVTGGGNVFSNFQVWGAFNGVQVSGSSAESFHDFQINNSINTGFLAQNGALDVYLNHFIINCGTMTACAQGGIRLYNQVEAFVAEGGDVLLGVNSLVADAATYSAATRPAYNKFVAVHFDSSAQGSLINHMVESHFIGSWWSAGRTGGGYNGLTVTNSDSLTFSENDFFNNGCSGALLNGGANQIDFIASKFQSNSVTAGSGVCHGLAVGSGVSNWNVIGGVASNGLYPGGQQGYGILVNSGTSNNYTIEGLLCTGNITNGGADSGSGASKNVNSPGCPGLTTTLSTFSLRQILPLSQVPSLIAANTTTYFNTATNVGEAQIWGIAPIAGHLKNLYISSSAAPGASQSYTFTLRINTNGQTLTCSISGAATTCNDTSHSVAIAAGQTYDFQVVTSASAANAIFTGGMEFDNP